MLTFRISAYLLFLLSLTEICAYFRPSDSPKFRQSSSIHAHSARLLLDKQKNQEALIEIKKALHSQPGNRGLSIKLAQMYYAQGEIDKSLDLLLPFQALSTRNSNVYYYIGLCHDKKKQYKDAYIYYKKAFKLDPTKYKAKLRIAQLFIKKGLYYDAATHLKNLLEINPEYQPAQLEFELTLRLIKENKHNTFRRGNLVITFPDYNLIRDVEEWYPFLQEKVYYMQNALGIQNQVVWIKIVPEIDTRAKPPAQFRRMENKIYLTVDSLRRKYTSLFAHELTYMFLHHMDIHKAPEWLKEGLAMYFSQPNLLKHLNIRRLRTGDDVFSKSFPQDKTYLHFNTLSENDKLDLFHAFLLVKYLITQYGWDNLERFVKVFESGTSTTAEAIWDTFHVEYRKFLLDFDVYMISRHFFKSG